MNHNFEKIKDQLIAEGYDEENIRVKTGLIFGAMPYFIAEGGKTNEGVTISFLFTKHLDPIQRPNTPLRGHKMGKVSLPADQISNLSLVPASYKFLCLDVPNANGQVVMKPIAVEFDGYINMTIDPVIKEKAKQSVHIVMESADTKQKKN